MTDRDKKIIEALIDGKERWEISDSQGISIRTLEAIIIRLKESFGANTQIEMVAKCYEFGWIKNGKFLHHHEIPDNTINIWHSVGTAPGRKSRS